MSEWYRATFRNTGHEVHALPVPLHLPAVCLGPVRKRPKPTVVVIGAVCLWDGHPSDENSGLVAFYAFTPAYRDAVLTPTKRSDGPATHYSVNLDIPPVRRGRRPKDPGPAVLLITGLAQQEHQS